MQKIRSFVRRNGRLTHGQQQALDTLFPRYGIETQQLDFDVIFQRQAPTFLEIGFGMGDSLVEMAQQNPENNYIGIDVHLPGIGRLLHRIADLDLTNLRVMNGDAVETLKTQIQPASLAGVYLFFPDPWHKKKHHKRRIVQPEFVELVASKLTATGIFHMATDWQHYAEHMLRVMSQQANFTNTASVDHYADKGNRPTTKFERRGIRLGHGVWDLIYQHKIDL